MNAIYPSVDVSYSWRPCETENSYYSPWTQTITLCTEFSQDPGAAVFVAAHEMAHAVTDQLADVLDENAADEVAALAMIKLDKRDELLAGAMWFRVKPNQKHIPGDPHPGRGFRAWELMCLEDGSEKAGAVECKALYYGIKAKWEHRLSTP